MIHTIPTVYIAGPFRAENAWEIEQNIRHAEEWGLRVAEMGCAPLIPHTNTRFFHGTMTDQFWLDATMALLRITDAAFFIPGWVKSTGAKAEFEISPKVAIQMADTAWPMMRETLAP